MGGSSRPDLKEAIKDAIIYMGFDAKLNKAPHLKEFKLLDGKLEGTD